MNSRNIKTSYPHRLILNPSDEINLKRINILLYQILATTVHGKYKKVI